MKRLFLSTVGIILFLQVSAQSFRESGAVNSKINPLLAGYHTLSIHVRDTLTHDSVFHFLAEKLKLPVSYNPVTYGKRRYVGVFAGNMVLEPCGPYTNFKYASDDFRAIFFGLNFESSVSLAGAESDFNNRGIQIRPAGKWLTVIDSMLCGENIVISVAEKNKKDERTFDSLRAGLLNVENGPGIEYVKTVLIGYKDNAGLQKWEEFVKPAEIDGNGIWKAYDQLEFLFVPGSIKEVRGIVFKVKSLKKAKRYLSKNDLMGSYAKHRLSLDKIKAFGLSIYFEE